MLKIARTYHKTGGAEHPGNISLSKAGLGSAMADNSCVHRSSQKVETTNHRVTRSLPGLTSRKLYQLKAHSEQ